ncbi:MAG: 3-hydroxyacyl-CoA dehydrogenase family protein [Candidatus Geothermarchaeales archaeon]
MEDIEIVAVIGAGTMGHGIAQVFAQAGYQVRMTDVKEEILQQALNNIGSNLRLFVAKGLITERSASDSLSRIVGSADLAEAAEHADFVTEAIPENMALKKRVFKELDEICLEHTILATNTSGLSVSEIASATKRPDRVVGTHWWNPPYIMPLVEIVRGAQTSNETVNTMHGLFTKLGKKPVVVLKDVPGFIGNRLQFAMFREAMSLLEGGVASKEDIDMAVKAGIGLRYPIIGPLQTADLGGLDVFLNVSEYLYGDLDRSTKPQALLRKIVEAGDYGAKTGRGIYDYEGRDVDALVRARDDKLLELLRIFGYI